MTDRRCTCPDHGEWGCRTPESIELRAGSDEGVCLLCDTAVGEPYDVEVREGDGELRIYGFHEPNRLRAVDAAIAYFADRGVTVRVARAGESVGSLYLRSDPGENA